MNYQHIGHPANYSTMRLFEIGQPVAEARNALVRRAFDHESDDLRLEYIFWLDDDVMPNRNAIVQLMSRQVESVSGVYFTKDPWPIPLWYDGPGEGFKQFIPDRFEPAGGHGMGLTLVKADLYRRLRDEGLPPDTNGNPSWYHTFNNDVMFMQGRTGVLSMTEDFFFLGLLKRIGVQSWVDSSINAFGWHISRETGRYYPEEQYKEFKTTGRVTWNTPDGPVVWGTPEPDLVTIPQSGE